jgi:hypothetical protein
LVEEALARLENGDKLSSSLIIKPEFQRPQEFDYSIRSESEVTEIHFSSPELNRFQSMIQEVLINHLSCAMESVINLNVPDSALPPSALLITSSI